MFYHSKLLKSSKFIILEVFRTESIKNFFNGCSIAALGVKTREKISNCTAVEKRLFFVTVYLKLPGCWFQNLRIFEIEDYNLWELVVTLLANDCSPSSMLKFEAARTNRVPDDVISYAN